MTSLELIQALQKQLFPTGRVFKMPKGGWLASLMTALSFGHNRLYTDALAIQNSILPDNANFSEDDATDWERRLGLINGTGTLLADRMAAITRKMNHPGTIKARQHYLYIQGQLQAAGFNVYVHENRFPDGFGGYTTKNPITIGGGSGVTGLQYGQRQYGQRQYGGTWGNIIVNNISERLDRDFNVGINLRSTFFIGGADLSSPATAYAYVPVGRKDAFRQLILKLKATQLVGYLFIIYI